MESSKRLSKYCLSINFLAEKRQYSQSPKSSKPERFSNQKISPFHKLFGSKNVVFFLSEKFKERTF